MEGYWRSIFYAVSCFVIYVSLNAQANEFATNTSVVVGHSYEIKEQDIIEYIKEKLQKTDLDILNQEMRAQVRASVERPKSVLNITKSQKDRTYYYDPTYVLKEDLKDHKGRIIHKRGYRVNPLEKIALSSVLIFIDGDEDAQVKYALKKQEDLKGQAKIILIKGAPLDLQKQHKTWIYFDQFGFLTSKLGIKHVPAVVTQEDLRLKIWELSSESLEKEISSVKKVNKSMR